MKQKPYWEIPSIRETSLTECISSYPLQPLERILDVKRRAASKACSEILGKNPEAEIVALIGSVARGDILGWFSDIDMLTITSNPREEEMMIVDHQPLFVEYHNWASFEDLMVKKIARDEYEDRSSYLSFYGNPHYLHSSEESRAKYDAIVRLGIEALWRDHSEIDEYLDDFVWFYGAAREALRYNLPLTSMGKLQRGTVLLLRYFLIKNKVLLRKPLPDERTMIQLRNSQVPKELVDFVEQLYRGRLDIDTLLDKGRKMYLQVTNGRKWMNQMPL